MEFMKKREDYKAHAKECRTMAAAAAPNSDYARALENMARTWDLLAEAAEEQQRIREFSRQ